jgi:pectinesterase
LNQYNIYSEVKTFEGAPHSFPFFNPWFQPMVETIDGFVKKVFEAKQAANIIWVANDGSGDFTKLQDALNAIPKNNKIPVTIYIRKGVYKEKLVLDSSKQFITLKGEDKFQTILTYDDHSNKLAPNGDTINTFTSYSFKQLADNFKAMDLTFENTAGNSAGQAVAMHVMGDKVQFINCRFLGHQDVLYAGTPGSRQYFEDCYIEGTTDFIFGPSIAWFQQCHINSKRNSHVTAASTPKDQPFGYVFYDCVLTSDSVQVNKVSLGRPWRPYSNVVYLNCFIGAHITPQGWDNWRNADNEKTARYGEYGSYGPGANPAMRFSWTRQLSDAEAKQITRMKVLGDWNPENE